MESTSAIKSNIKHYWDWRSSSYGLDADRSRQVENLWHTVMKELAGDGRGKQALDIGTGTGQFAFYLARQGYKVTGIDLSEKMIELAGVHAVQSGLEIDFRTGDAEHLDFEDNHFDLVVSRNLLWTLVHPEEAVREWHRVLKPKGKIILSDGFWQNDTWKRLSVLAAKVLKSLCSCAWGLNLRFFSHYCRFQKQLPFYEGILSRDARNLMESHFKDIRFYDTARLGFNPYEDDKQFFIVHATK